MNLNKYIDDIFLSIEKCVDESFTCPMDLSTLHIYLDENLNIIKYHVDYDHNYQDPSNKLEDVELFIKVHCESKDIHENDDRYNLTCNKETIIKRIQHCLCEIKYTLEDI